LLHEERDRLSQLITEHGAKEQEFTRKLEESKAAAVTLRGECAALYAERKELLVEFRAANAAYEQQREEARSLAKKKRDLERFARQEAKQREL
jgi:hypothetical protein